MNVSTLDVTTNFDISGIKTGAEEGKKALSGLVDGFESLGKAALSPLSMVTTGVSGLVEGLGKVGWAAQGLKAVGGTFASMFNGLTAGNAALEMTTISFKTLLGSASAADTMIKQLTQFAAATPFELTGLEASTQKLLAFGFGAKDIIPLMTSMGDAISALGGTQDNLNSLVYVMGQMRGEAHLNAGDIMQMTNLGIPALQMLADHYKVTTGQMQEMISKGLVPGKDAVAIFTTSLEQRYGGMMAAQSATFSGMISNLHDWATATTNTLTKPFFEPAKKGLGELLGFVQSPAGQTAVDTLAGYIQTGVNTIISAFSSLANFLHPVLAGLMTVFSGVWQFLNTYLIPPLRTFAQEIGEKVVTAVGLLTDRFKDALPVLEGVFGKIQPLIQPVISKFLELFQAVSPFSIVLDTVIGLLKDGLPGAFAALGKHVVDFGKIFGIDLSSQVNGFNSFITGTLMPTLNMIAQTVVEKVIPAVLSFGKTLFTEIIPNILSFAASIVNAAMPVIASLVNIVVTKLIPGIGDLFGWISKNIIPIFAEFFKILETNVVPSLIGLGKFIAEKVIPSIMDLVKWVGDTLVPAFEALIKVFVEHVMPVLGQVFSFIVDQAIPILFSWWQVIATVLKPVIEQLVNFFTGVFLPAVTTVFDFIGGTVIPLVKGLAWEFETYLLPVLKTVADVFGNVLGRAIDIVTTGIKILWNVWSTFFEVVRMFVGGEIQVVITVFQTLGNVIGTVVGGAIGGLMWGINNIILPGFNLMVSVIGNIINFIKTAVRTIANFFIDAINTPLNLINTLIDALKNAPVIGGAFGWLGHIPTLGYLSFAQGTQNAPGGPSMVGDNPYGPELVETNGQKYLVSAPTLTLLNRGDKVTPIAGGSGGTTIQAPVNIYLTVTGQPDDVTLARLQQVAQEAVEVAISNVGVGTSSRKGFAGTQR